MEDTDLYDLALILFGVCIWDYFTSLWFEYRLLTKKIVFRWEFVPYFLARYTNLGNSIFCLVGLSIDPDVISSCALASLRNSGVLVGTLSIVFSTWNLLIRTIIIWGHHPFVMKPLLAIGFLHLVLGLTLALVGRPPCVLLPPGLLIVTAHGITTAVIELAILILSWIGIRRASQHKESNLARFLKTRGIVYFVMVFSMQASVVIATFAQTDGITGMFVGTISTTIIPLLSCRLVTSTLSQDHLAGSTLGTATHRIKCFELSESRGQNTSSGRMTTCLEVTKGESESVF